MDTEILVIGAGAAGLSAALNAAPRRVLLLAPEGPEASSTELAKGGIAAPVGQGDSVALHAADTLRAADHSGSESMTDAIIGAAVEAIDFLERAGMRFDACGDGPGPDLHLEAGHSMPRVLHADGDRTGAAIQKALFAQACASAHITVCRDLHAIALHSGSDGVTGVTALRNGGPTVVIHAAETVLATGGVGQLFAATTNPRHAAGDGLAMALGARADVAGLEFVQFHPTALHCGLDPLPLLTEALRGAGARLTANGVRFMRNVDPRGDLAPRDIVARAVWEEQHRGHAVLLDATAIFGSERRHGFPAALAACVVQGLDPAHAPVPVTCAAHFHMGGIVITAEGRSSLPGLWAAGEAAFTGLHGANRLASNSLLEAVVIGAAAGKALRAQKLRARTRNAHAAVHQAAPLDPGRTEWRRLRELMWTVMGPVRSGPDLAAALGILRGARRRLDAADIILRQRHALAEAMIAAALAREESRGAHWRSDFAVRNRRLDGAGALRAPYAA